MTDMTRELRCGGQRQAGLLASCRGRADPRPDRAHASTPSSRISARVRQNCGDVTEPADWKYPLKVDQSRVRADTPRPCDPVRRCQLLLTAILILLPACVGSGPGHGPVSPSSRLFVSASAAFDGDRGDLVLLALVETPSGPTNETWTWKGRWSQLHPTHSPTPPRSAILVDDPADRAVLLYGGAYAPMNGTAKEFADMWSWDGVDWHEIPLAVPLSGHASGYAYVPSKGELLMSFHGNPFADSGTYRWDVTAWTRISSGTFPDGTVAVDAGSGSLISYNGRRHGCAPDPCWSDVSRTEIYDGVRWTVVIGGAPEPAAGNLVTDPTDGGVLMLNELGHTWVWIKGRWLKMATQGPSPSSNGFLYSDGARVWYQTEPDYPQQRRQWDGRAWHRD